MPKLKNKTIRFQITLIVLLMVTIIALLSVFYYVSFVSIILRNNMDYFTQRFDTVLLRVNNRMNEIERQLDLVASSTNAELFFNSKNAWDRSAHAEAMINNLSSIVETSNPVDAAVIMIQRDNIVLPAHSLQERTFSNLLNQIMRNTRGYGRVEPLCFLEGEPQTAHYILNRTINVFSSDLLQQSRMGELYVAVSLQKLMDTIGEDHFGYAFLYERSNRWEVCAVSEDDRTEQNVRAFLSAQRQDDSFFTDAQGKTFIYSIAPIGETKLYLLMTQPRNELYSDSYSPIIAGGVIIAAALLFSLFGLKYIDRSITAPIGEMEQSMHRIREGELSHRLGTEGDSELTRIALSVNQLLDELQERTRLIMETQEQLYQTELLNKESRLLALQFQINPHFLYNTLECVRSISSVHKIPEVSELINAMIGIFRYSTYSGSKATVRDELDCCRSYAEIIAIRFQGKYTIEFQADEACMDVPMLKMTLQPILENAVSHGLEARGGVGRISVNCALQADRIEITVHDNGAGMEQEELERLRVWLDSADNGDRIGGVGLKNVHQRLIHEYGAEYGIHICSEKNRFTTVIVHIPCSERGTGDHE